MIVGAKFRMLRMPTSTIRSHTGWAATAGVAITPMPTPCSATTSARSSKLRISRPATISPCLLVSASSSATVRKPLEEKPE